MDIKLLEFFTKSGCPIYWTNIVSGLNSLHLFLAKTFFPSLELRLISYQGKIFWSTTISLNNDCFVSPVQNVPSATGVAYPISPNCPPTGNTQSIPNYSDWSRKKKCPAPLFHDNPPANRQIHSAPYVLLHPSTPSAVALTHARTLVPQVPR